MSRRLVLAADAGGTKTNVALVPVDDGAHLGVPLAAATYPSHDFPSLEAILDAFRAAHAGVFSNGVDAATIGFAGPIAGGRGAGSNVPWAVDAASLARHLGLPRVGLVNDLVATGYGVVSLGPEQLVPLLPGTAAPDANAAILAAGTGLGEAILARVGAGFLPIDSEGGHADYAPRTDTELEIWRLLRSRHGRVSVERVLSGPGLANVAEAIHARAGAEAAWRAHEREAGGAAALPGAVSTKGLEGSCPACAEALDVFAGIYGSEAGNLALRCVARSGVYLAGGIAPRILPALRGPAFERAFRDKEPHRALLAAIPVWVVLDDRAALWGAARHAAGALSPSAS
ncbi:MAG TPA: glucokinase [Candidatus Eisenbacteria bacterium]|nr:glucokinase [Candidatus Eisenbacteria bacterium]